jgi:hypothetical protein
VAPDLARLIKSCTCFTCQGTGRFGGVEAIQLPGGKVIRNDLSYTCRACDGSGIQPMADD